MQSCSRSTKMSSLSSSELALAREVLFLHSLWRQGPPSGASASRNRNRNRNLQPASVAIKKKKKNKNKKKKSKKTETRDEQNEEENKENASERHVEQSQKQIEGEGEGEGGPSWACTHAAKQSQEWDVWNSTDSGVENAGEQEAAVAEVPLSEGECQKLREAQAQQRAVKAFKEFFSRGKDDDSMDEEDEDEDDDAGEANQVTGKARLRKEDEVQGFFAKLFEEDEELRKYYENNSNCGSFECIVCSSAGEKTDKRFTECASLVQHATKILRTKRRGSHRGYGKAVCALLGWSADRLPRAATVKVADISPRACIAPVSQDGVTTEEVEGTQKIADDKQEKNSGSVSAGSNKGNDIKDIVPEISSSKKDAENPAMNDL